MPEPLIAAFHSKTVKEWRNDIVEAIRGSGTLRHHDRKEILFYQGAPATAVYAIKSGMIETSGLNEAGREVTLAVRGPGEPFGCSEVIVNEPRRCQARVLQEAEIWHLDAARFMDMLPHRPDILLAMLGSELYHITRSSEKRTDLRGTSAYNRIGYALSSLANKTSDLARAEKPRIRVTHEELSHICDLSRQTVTTTLGVMQQRGIIALGLRSIQVIDRARLDPAGPRISARRLHVEPAVGEPRPRAEPA